MIDWAAIRADYEAGAYPGNASLGKAYGVSGEGIRKRAIKEKWSKALASATHLIRRAAQETPDDEPLPTVMAITGLRPEQATQAVQTAAAAQVEVIRQHRATIARDTTFCDGLMGYLQLAVQTNPPDTVLQVDGLAETFEKLVRCRERLVRMERVAFGMNGTEGDAREDGVKLTDDQQEALREAIKARFGRGMVIDGTATEMAQCATS